MIFRIAFGAIVLAGLVRVQDPAKAEWMADKERAFEEARRTGKPLFVVFR